MIDHAKVNETETHDERVRMRNPEDDAALGATDEIVSCQRCAGRMRGAADDQSPIENR